MKKVISLILALTLFVSVLILPANASVKQTESSKTRNSSTGSWYITAYAGFDRVATIVSNANQWDYYGKSKVYNAPVKGTNILTITCTATLKTSSSLSIAGGAKSASASSSSSWQTISASWTKKKAQDKGKTYTNSEVNNLIVQPRKYYKANTAGITVSAGFLRGDSDTPYTIQTAA